MLSVTSLQVYKLLIGALTFDKTIYNLYFFFKDRRFYLL